MHTRSPPTPAPPCPAQPWCVKHRAAPQNPRSPAWGSLGEGSTPYTTHPSVQGCCFLGFLPSGGGNWQMRQRAGERLGQQLRVSQTGLMLGHGGLTAPRLPSKHPQPTLQLSQGLSLCHPLHAWIAHLPGQKPSSLPCPCIAQEMLGAPRRVPQGKEPLRDVPQAGTNAISPVSPLVC